MSNGGMSFASIFFMSPSGISPKFARYVSCANCQKRKHTPHCCLPLQVGNHQYHKINLYLYISSLSFPCLGPWKSPHFVVEMRARKRLRGARLSTAYTRQQSYCPRPRLLRARHPLPCLTDVFGEVLILLQQPNQGCSKTHYFSMSYSRF